MSSSFAPFGGMRVVHEELATTTTQVATAVQQQLMLFSESFSCLPGDIALMQAYASFIKGGTAGYSRFTISLNASGGVFSALALAEWRVSSQPASSTETFSPSLCAICGQACTIQPELLGSSAGSNSNVTTITAQIIVLRA